MQSTTFPVLQTMSGWRVPLLSWSPLAAVTLCYVRIQENPGRHSRALTAATASLWPETPTECHRGGWQLHRGQQPVSTAVQRTCGCRSTSVLCTEWKKKNEFSIILPKATESNRKLLWQQNIHAVAYYSTECRKSGGTGDDKGQQAEHVTKDLCAVLLKKMQGKTFIPNRSE